MRGFRFQSNHAYCWSGDYSPSVRKNLSRRPSDCRNSIFLHSPQTLNIEPLSPTSARESEENRNWVVYANKSDDHGLGFKARKKEKRWEGGREWVYIGSMGARQGIDPAPGLSNGWR